MLRALLLVASFGSTLVFAQGPQTALVRAPNEGGTRVYVGSPEDVLEAGAQASEALGLAVTRAPDGSVFIASPTPWMKRGLITFPKTLVVKVRVLSPKETELVVDEEGRGQPLAGADGRIAAFHEQVLKALGDVRPKKAIVPKHPQESLGEPVLIKQVDLVGIKPSEDTEQVRAWSLAKQYSKEVGTSLMHLAGAVPLHFTPVSQRRFQVLEGQVRMSVGTRDFWVAAGDFVVVPKGVRTQLDVEPGAKATLLVVEAPPVDDTKTVWLEKKEKGGS